MQKYLIVIICVSLYLVLDITCLMARLLRGKLHWLFDIVLDFRG